jgi:hypothetical protein
MSARRLSSWIALLAFATFATAALADAGALSSRHSTWRADPAHSATGLPIAIESADEGGVSRGDIYGLLAFPFAQVAARLAMPRDWCDIALLHLNIKTCTHERDTNGDTLTFYSGRKFYEPPERAYALRYAFRVLSSQPDYLQVVLSAPTGPLDTRDYQILFEAIPAGEQTFVHFRYAYRPSATSRMATKGYLATLGAGKSGFTVIGQTRDGKPEYVGGIRGIVERNAVRKYLAIQAFLESLELPESQRFARRVERWIDLTERYPRQLHELERAEYLSNKQQEYRQQRERQQAIDARQPAAAAQ